MKWLCLFINLVFSIVAFSQAGISGRVVSANNKPIAGASVFIPNTAIGASTNSSGEFILNGTPSGNFKIVVSYIGYESLATAITGNEKDKHYLFTLSLKIDELESVVVGRYDKGGWPKWGSIFTEGFIGTSAFAENCTITNKDIIRFVFVKNQNQLRAFADKPLLIQNKALGYTITVELVDFVYDMSNKTVDYQVYNFFQPMKGTEDELITWKNNRKEAYAFSFMHFMRSLYADNFKKEGFEVRMMERKANTEKKRVQEIYKKEFGFLKDSLNKNEMREKVLTKMLERRFAKDSLKRYKKILEEEDLAERIYPTPLTLAQFASKNDSTVQLNFSNYLAVTYNKKKEPDEYFYYRQPAMQNNDVAIKVTNPEKRYPFTFLYLVQGIPIEIYENGYFNNIDLMIDGFWGWWEKLATKLPYDYTP